jgi:thiamine pyrophosphate-dependent acetolactate synthase large subunit-like protein
VAKVADYVLNRLSEWGIHRIYGYPGDGINGFLGALDRAKGDPELIQPRHEEMGAFMATAHAKFTGEVGCAMATSRPGAIHLLNGLYDARDRSWRESIEKEVTEWWRVLDDRAHDSAAPMNPQLVAHELSPRLPDGVILTADSGSSTNWWAQHLRLHQGMRASLSGNLATMGPGTPYAIGAKFAYPQLPVIAFVGDGAFQMNGMAEMVTVKRYWERWPNPTLIFCVFNNQGRAERRSGDRRDHQGGRAAEDA